MAWYQSDWFKLALSGITLIAWVFGIVISLVAIVKGSRMRETMGVSSKAYFAFMAVAEVFYTAGAVLILTAMGVNILQHLANLDILNVYRIVSHFDVTTINVIGTLGWVGFGLYCASSFLAPGYLLVVGGRKLDRYFWVVAWTEVGLEAFAVVAIFFSLLLQ